LSACFSAKKIRGQDKERAVSGRVWVWVRARIRVRVKVRIRVRIRVRVKVMG
jgi:hypothetical protein